MLIIRPATRSSNAGKFIYRVTHGGRDALRKQCSTLFLAKAGSNLQLRPGRMVQIHEPSKFICERLDACRQTRGAEKRTILIIVLFLCQIR